MSTPTAARPGTTTIAAHALRGRWTGLTPVPPPPQHTVTVLRTGAPLWAYAVVALAAAVITLTLLVTATRLMHARRTTTERAGTGRPDLRPGSDSR